MREDTPAISTSASDDRVPKLASTEVDRRWLLGAAATSAGVLLFACRSLAASHVTAAQLSPFLRLDADGSSIFYVPAAEMGQDAFTTLAKIFAEEARLDWGQLRIEHAPHDPAFYNSLGTQATGGSRTVRQWYARLRATGAAVREALIAVAAERFGVAGSELHALDGQVWHSMSGKRAGFHELAPLLHGRPLPTSTLTRPNRFRMIGRDVPRRDTLAKITGTAVFGADVRLPDMVYAAVTMVPEWSNRIGRVTIPTDLGPDVIATHRFDNAVAVVARSWSAASRAATSIGIVTRQESGDPVDDARVARKLAEALARPRPNIVAQAGDVDRALTSAHRHAATYDVPYLAHACMETMTATVQVGDGEARVIVPTQSPDRIAQVVADLLGLPLAKVRVENVFLGGGFGRKGTDFQAVRQAAVLARRFKRPVQVIWDRETDIRNDLYRPAASFAYEASLATLGSIAAIRTTAAMQSTRKQRFPQFYRASGHEAPEHLFPYAARAFEHRWSEADLPVAVGYWRSIDNSHYPFATESFVDELAHLAGRDAIAFRLAHLADRPRAKSVIEAVARMAGWGRAVAPGRGLGVALIDAWDSCSAQVAEVSVTNGKLRVEKIWTAVDCGLVVSPQSVRDQVEGGIMYGLTAALDGRIGLQNGNVVESNFHDYPVMRLADAPEIAVQILASSSTEPGGVGELGTPPCAPAVANAIFAATGRRIRRLPLNGAFN